MRWLLSAFPALIAFGCGLGAYLAHLYGIGSWWFLLLSCAVGIWCSGFAFAMEVDL